MGRKRSQVRLEQIYRTVQENPGSRPGLIARLLGLHRSEVTRALPVMEEKRLLIAEDEKGRLWPFQK